MKALVRPLTSLVMAPLMALSASSTPQFADHPLPPGRRLLEFDTPAAVAVWRPIHDGVMGGVSTGTATAVDGAVRFEGRVSLENNGGFASYRAGVALPDLSSAHGLRLRVRGDGQVWKLSLRTDGGPDGREDGLSWQAPFATVDGMWTLTDIAFEDLVPTWRGRLVNRMDAFDPSGIRQVGLLIADKQVGPYALELASIGSWRAAPEVSVASGARAFVHQEGRADEGRRAAAAGSRAAAVARTRGVAALIDAARSDGGELDGRVLADALAGDERLLVVTTPRDLDESSSRLVGEWIAFADTLLERELRVVQLLGPRGGRVAGRALTADQVATLRARWKLPADEGAVALVGKDGGVKARWDAPPALDDIVARIDAMPMRRAEAAARRD